MRKILVTFTVLLAILMLISALGGSLNASERFYEEAMEKEMEHFYEEVSKEEPENYEDVPKDDKPPVAPQTPTKPATTETYYEDDAQQEESIEPFEEDNTYMPY